MSVQEAVRLAKEALGEATAPDMAAWIAANLGLTVKPAIVAVMLGSFQEKEHLERARLKAMELIEKAKAEDAEKPKRRRKATASGRNDCLPSHPALQCPPGNSEEEKSHKPTAARGCPACGSGEYVFRGRKKVAPQPGDEGPVMETKHACRGCGHQWRVRKPV